MFKHFPLPMHNNAQKASEASECAREQGKFWEYHDKLLQNQRALEVTNLKQYAADLGLDPAEVIGSLGGADAAIATPRRMRSGVVGIEITAVPECVDLLELPANPRRVVVLALGLPPNLLGQRDRHPRRCERQRARGDLSSGHASRPRPHDTSRR